MGFGAISLDQSWKTAFEHALEVLEDDAESLLKRRDINKKKYDAAIRRIDVARQRAKNRRTIFDALVDYSVAVHLVHGKWM